jgi:hypothetical protein
MDSATLSSALFTREHDALMGNCIHCTVESWAKNTGNGCWHYCNRTGDCEALDNYLEKLADIPYSKEHHSAEDIAKQQLRIIVRCLKRQKRLARECYEEHRGRITDELTAKIEEARHYGRECALDNAIYMVEELERNYGKDPDLL